jgi:hypothetical protein
MIIKILSFPETIKKLLGRDTYRPSEISENRPIREISCDYTIIEYVVIIIPDWTTVQRRVIEPKE